MISRHRCSPTCWLVRTPELPISDDSADDPIRQAHQQQFTHDQFPQKTQNPCQIRHTRCRDRRRGLSRRCGGPGHGHSVRWCGYALRVKSDPGSPFPDGALRRRPHLQPARHPPRHRRRAPSPRLPHPRRLRTQRKLRNALATAIGAAPSRSRS